MVSAARSCALEVASHEAVFAHAEQVQSDSGAVQVLVNNAGAGIVGRIEHLSIEEIEWPGASSPGTWRACCSVCRGCCRTAMPMC